MIDFIRKKTEEIFGGHKGVKPKHVAFVIEDLSSLEDLDRRFEELYNMIFSCISLNIPAVSFMLLSKSEFTDSPDELFRGHMSKMNEFFSKLAKDKHIHVNGVKLNMAGKWYSLPDMLVESLKECISETKDYDRFFFNFYLNYDSQDEIVDSVRLLSRQVKDGKLDPDMITKDTLREYLYFSSILPPDLIIITGDKRCLGKFLYWDSGFAVLHLIQDKWVDFDASKLRRSFDLFSEHRKV